MNESLIDILDVKDAAFDDDLFEALVATWGIDETRLAFANLSSALLAQFTKRSGSSSQWNKSGAGVIKVRSDARLNDLKTRIADRNREEAASIQAIEKKWGMFAQEVARALYLLDPAALHGITGPGAGDIAGDEWLHSRLSAQARKAAN